MPVATMTMMVAFRPKSRFSSPFTKVLVPPMISPDTIPPTGPVRIATEMTALVAHSVVGQVWLFHAHSAPATYDVDNISAQTTSTSAPTHTRLRANPTK